MVIFLAIPAVCSVFQATALPAVKVKVVPETVANERLSPLAVV